MGCSSPLKVYPTTTATIQSLFCARKERARSNFWRCSSSLSRKGALITLLTRRLSNTRASRKGRNAARLFCNQTSQVRLHRLSLGAVTSKPWILIRSYILTTAMTRAIKRMCGITSLKTPWSTPNSWGTWALSRKASESILTRKSSWKQSRRSESKWRTNHATFLYSRLRASHRKTMNDKKSSLSPAKYLARPDSLAFKIKRRLLNSLAKSHTCDSSRFLIRQSNRPMVVSR